MDRKVFGVRCEACGWMASTDSSLSTEEVSRRGVEHHVETEHVPIAYFEISEDC